LRTLCSLQSFCIVVVGLPKDTINPLVSFADRRQLGEVDCKIAEEE
jgi:hypothetical protein